MQYAALALLTLVAAAPTPAKPVAQAQGSHPPLSLLDADSFFGCREVEGSYLILLRPGIGTLVLSSSAFPGSQIVGRASDGRLRFSIPGLRLQELDMESRLPPDAESEIWGLLFRGDQTDQPGCIGADHGPFATDDDVRSFVDRVVDRLYLSLAMEELGEGRALRLDGRVLVFEVRMEGGPTTRVEVTNGEPKELHPTDPTRAYELLPLLLDSATGRVLLQVSPTRQGSQPQALPNERIVLEEGAETALFEGRMRIRLLSAGTRSPR